MLLAFDHGIYSASRQDLERMSIHQSKATNDYKRVYNLYEDSSFWIPIEKHFENKNILQFAFYVLLIGFSRATLSLILKCAKKIVLGPKLSLKKEFNYLFST